MDGAKPIAVMRFETIDLLRGVSILAVILLHIRIMFGIRDAMNEALPDWLAYLLFNNGANGVTIFFAVSGFLITSTSIRRFGSLSDLQPAAFYTYRFARIAPLLLLVLAILSALHLFSVQGFEIDPQRTDLAHALFAALTFHLNWLEAAKGYLPASWDILWSLSVEEMFYLFFPLLCFALLRWRAGWFIFIAALVVLIAIAPLARTVWTENELWKAKSYFSNMDAVAMGCLTALLVQSLRQRGLHLPRAALVALQASGAALIVLIMVWPHWQWLFFIGRHGLDVTILPFATCMVIAGSVLAGSAGGGMLFVPLRWLGRHSYEVYLTHMFVIIAGAALYTRLAWGPIALWIVAMVVLSALLGALVARYFSEPLNNWLRTRSAPSGRRQVSAQDI